MSSFCQCDSFSSDVAKPKNKWKNDNFENVGRTSRKHVFWTNLAHAYLNPWLYSVRFFHQVASKHSQSLMIVTKQGFLIFTSNFDLKGVIHLKNLKSTLVAPNSAITFSIMRDGLSGVAQKSLNHVRTYLIFGSHCCKSVCRSFSRSCQTHNFSNSKCSCPLSGDNDYGVVNQKPNFVCLPEQLMKGVDDVNKNAQRNKNFCKIMRNVECLNYRHRVSNLLVFAKLTYMQDADEGEPPTKVQRAIRNNQRSTWANARVRTQPRMGKHNFFRVTFLGHATRPQRGCKGKGNINGNLGRERIYRAETQERLFRRWNQTKLSRLRFQMCKHYTKIYSHEQV